VKPYVKRNKHDAADAEACCEAVQRPSMRFIPIKSPEQQCLLMLHRIRDRLLAERTASINAIRGHLAEFGIVAAQGARGLGELRAVIGDVDDHRLPARARALLAEEVEHLRELEAHLERLDRELLAQARTDEACQRLTGVPGIGPVIATALVATVGDAKLFRNGRSLAAWLGLTPKQHSSGGKELLLGISRRGDGYLRRQLMHGARSLVRIAQGREGKLWAWINGLLARRSFNTTVAAVANKLARIVHAVLSRTGCRPEPDYRGFAVGVGRRSPCLGPGAFGLGLAMLDAPLGRAVPSAPLPELDLLVRPRWRGDDPPEHLLELFHRHG
jgi:transposase